VDEVEGGTTMRRLIDIVGETMHNYCYRHRYTLKLTTQVSATIGVENFIEMHRYPKWMPIKMHLCLEKLILKTLRLDPHRKIHFSKAGIPMHIFHGIICDYPMKEIIDFLRNPNDRQYFAKRSDRG